MLAPWLNESLQAASRTTFGNDFGNMGRSKSIPFVPQLSDMFPQAQFVITGVLGPQSNAHGPNEFLHIPFAKGITECVAKVVQDHCAHFNAVKR